MRLLLSFAAAISVAAACSSNPPPPPSTGTASSATPPASATPAAPAGISRGEFAAKMAKTICEASVPCCTNGASLDDGLCTSQLLGSLGWKELLEKAKTYESKHAEKCLDEARAMAVKCDAAPKEVLRRPSCAALLTGPKKTGEPCEESEDCAAPAKGNAFCWQGAMADAPGRCAVSLPPEKGAACFTPLGKEDKQQLSFSECNDDPALSCDKATNKCGPRLKAGAACEQTYECEETGACIGGKCKTLLGATCKGPRDCAIRQSCTNGKCGPGKKLGEKCSDLGECVGQALCSKAGTCVSWAGAFLCKAPAH